MIGVFKRVKLRLGAYKDNRYRHLTTNARILQKIIRPRINSLHSNTRPNSTMSVGGSFENMNQLKKVIVIGAGAAGIAAATRLYERGVEDVIVLEAENRIGGRIFTVDLPDDEGFIELGAQWVHGERKNVVFEMMAGRDLLHSEGLKFSNFQFVRSTSEIINKEISDELYEHFGIVYYGSDGLDLKKYKSSGDYLPSKLKETFQKLQMKAVSPEVLNEFIQWCHQYLNSYEGTDSWFDSSILTLSEYWPCEGCSTISWKENGYRKLFSILMEKAQEMSNGKFSSSNILTNKEVKKIQMNDDKVTVECNDGSSYLANHVILTVSLGVLKEQYKQLFDDICLPESKVEAIEKLGIGCVNKLFFKFPHQWIPQNINGICVLWKDEDIEEYSKQGLKWVTDVFVFCRVDNAPNVICGWVTGSSARKIELLEESEVRYQITRLLRKIVGHQYEIPDPEYLIGSTWSSNPHFRGSYRFLTPETDAVPAVVQSLVAPLENENGIPVILFAGEATHEHYYSTVHGAVETGWREADRILSLASR